MPAQIKMVLSNNNQTQSLQNQNFIPSNTFVMGTTGNNRIHMNMFALNKNKGGCRSCGGK